jgi:hypothetical protein
MRAAITWPNRNRGKEPRSVASKKMPPCKWSAMKMAAAITRLATHTSLGRPGETAIHSPHDGQGNPFDCLVDT